jgi:hypothetical protein
MRFGTLHPSSLLVGQLERRGGTMRLMVCVTWRGGQWCSADVAGLGCPSADLVA